MDSKVRGESRKKYTLGNIDLNGWTLPFHSVGILDNGRIDLFYLTNEKAVHVYNEEVEYSNYIKLLDNIDTPFDKIENTYGLPSINDNLFTTNIKLNKFIITKKKRFIIQVAKNSSVNIKREIQAILNSFSYQLLYDFHTSHYGEINKTSINHPRKIQRDFVNTRSVGGNIEIFHNIRNNKSSYESLKLDINIPNDTVVLSDRELLKIFLCNLEYIDIEAENSKDIHLYGLDIIYSDFEDLFELSGKKYPIARFSEQ